MPPKKNVNKTEVVHKIRKEKVPKTRFKKEKPQLKKPTIIRVKMPIPGSDEKKNEVQPEVSTPKVANKKVLDKASEEQAVKKKNVQPKISSLKVATKKMIVKIHEDEGAKKSNTIQLAMSPPKVATKKLLMLDRINEVAKAQLVKACPVNFESTPENIVVKKKRGRKKKIILDPEAELGAEEAPPKKKAKKSPAKLSSTGEKPKEKRGRPRKIPINTPTLPKPIAKPKTITETDSNRVKRKYTKRKNVTNITNNDNDSTITSPSILSQKLMDRLTSKETPKPPKPPDNDNNADSRRTSVTSASEWSWTKDISGSSTTTCITVHSTDFVRIDGKLPVVKLNNISCDLKVEALREKKEGEHSLSEDSSSSSSSSSSSDSSSSVNTAVDNLNLSTSSVSPRLQSPTYTPVDASDISPKKNTLVHKQTTFELLASKLQKFTLESWSEDDGYDFLNLREFEERMFNVMDEERDVLFECNILSQILSEKCSVSEENNLLENNPIEPEASFAKPDVTVIPNKPVERNDFSYDCGKRRDSMSFDTNDDEDALSLYAESLTGIESSRVSSTASVAQEYVPQAVRRDTFVPVARHYQPTRIEEPKTKPVCEKQNADSTSLQKEVVDTCAYPSVAEKPSGIVNPRVERRYEAAWGPRLTIDDFEPPQGNKLCSALRGVCFYNLISNCKRVNCRYPHRELDVDMVAFRISKMSETRFLQEYMHIVRWPTLRMKYSQCFIEECQKRELPKFLMEMVIVYMKKASLNCKEDMAIQVDIIEFALLYLNGVDLSVCQDLLKYKFGNNKLLCEVFMETIANTQNFWRFKLVFLNLTNFMVRQNRTFKLQVAAQILERVCIFPFEPPLALVILSILEHTDRKIFENSMMEHYEKQLISFSKDMHERFLAIKERSGAPPAAEPASEPEVTQEVGPLSGAPITSDNEKRYTSPDTTNLDNQAKPPIEPIITRTINFNKIRNLNTNKAPEQNPGNFKSNFSNNWSHRTIYDKIPRMSGPQGFPGPQQRPRGPFGPPLRPRPPLKRPMGRQVLYEQRHFKYPRRSGPDHYGNQ